MTGTSQPLDLEVRLAALQVDSADAVATLRDELGALQQRIVRLEAASAGPRQPPLRGAVPGRVVPPQERRSPAASRALERMAGGAAPVPATGADGQALSDLIGGRVLAWVGGIATLTGTVLFLALAIARGWIGEEARVVVAALASSLLMGAGMWLHDRRGRTEASVVMVGAASAALFATLLVATQVYDLLPAAVALPATLAVGALTTRLAVRWAGAAVGGIGLLGGLLSPVLVGASPGAVTVAVVALAAACAAAVVIRTGWGWLGLASVLVCIPQWGAWLVEGQSAPVTFVVLSWFAAVGLATAVGVQERSGAEPLRISAAAVATISAFATALIGWVAFDAVGGRGAAEACLALIAVLQLGAGAALLRRGTTVDGLSRLLLAIGVVLADVTIGVSTGGLVSLVAWSATAVGFAWVARDAARGGADEALAAIALGAHLTLALVQALVAVPPSALGATGEAQLLPLLAASALAASCLASAHLLGTVRPAWRSTINCLGLATIAYLTAATLSDTSLVFAWALEALALTRITRRDGDPVARHAGLAFLGLAAAHVLVVEAPPSALVVGVSEIGAAAVSLGVIAAAAFGMARLYPPDSRLRLSLMACGAAASVLLASVTLVSLFQPTAGASTETVLDLGVRQQGQLLLSIAWTAIGLTALLWGLKRRHPMLRSAALVWLMVTVAKVFLYDLSTLTSLYRVASFIVLGLLLLAGAFAYQRLRPPPVPDMRKVHPSQR
jgi:uncharacterized membrane protein